MIVALQVTGTLLVLLALWYARRTDHPEDLGKMSGKWLDGRRRDELRRESPDAR